jgi:ADP-heptose:LPS heptosyltransferase
MNGSDARIRFFPSEDLVTSAVVIAGARTFVGTDSGPLHLAALLGRKVVGLFGPSPPRLTAPGVEGGVFLYSSVACSPCSQRSCVAPDDWCMDRIQINGVFEAVAQSVVQPTFKASGVQAKN